jgi:hypothetical protein
MEARRRHAERRLVLIDPPSKRPMSGLPPLVHVLCVLEVVGRDSVNRTVRYQDSLVVLVRWSREIPGAVNCIVHDKIDKGTWRHALGVEDHELRHLQRPSRLLGAP